MSLYITSLTLHKDHQPDFDTLKSRGWKHPEWRGQLLEGSLVKSCGNFEVQVTQHKFGVQRDRAESDTYTEIFLHSNTDRDDLMLLKGHGHSIQIGDVVQALLWLEEELI